MKSKKSAALELVQLCCRVLDEKKAGDLAVLDVSKHSSITDYLVIATATSEPHLRALRVELEKAIDAAGVHLVGIEARQESGWLVIDAFDVMIHLFLPQTRERFGLERLWQDAANVSVSEALAKTVKAKAPRKRRATVTRKRSAAAGKRKRGNERRSE
jgi:ribosome-associated protein